MGSGHRLVSPEPDGPTGQTTYENGAAVPHLDPVREEGHPRAVDYELATLRQEVAELRRVVCEERADLAGVPLASPRSRPAALRLLPGGLRSPGSR